MKIALSRLSTSTLSWLADQIITDSKSEKFPFIENHPLLTALQATYVRYDAVFGKQSYSGQGKIVAAANVRQNDAFNGMKFCLYGMSKVSGNSMQTDAKDLYKIFKSAGVSLTRHKYMTKSAELVKLIEALDKPENATKIERVHLTEIFGILKAAYINFEKLSLEQAGANAKLRLMGTASALRKELERDVHNYLSVLTAMKQQEGWSKLYMLLNEIVKSARNSHRKGKDPTEPTT